MERPWKNTARLSIRHCATPSPAGPASTTSSSAPASPAACWPSGWPAGSDKRVLHRRQAAAHRRQRLRPLRRRRHPDPPVRPAHLPHQLARGLRLPVAASPSGGRTSTACWPASTASWCRSRSTSTPSTGCTALQPHRRSSWRSSSRRSPSRATDPRPPKTWSSAKVGRELYEKFFRGYTRKQWGLDPSELDAAVTARVPTRTNRDDRYFTDTLPGDAAARLHAHVRADARPPEHQDHAQHRLSRDRRPRAVRRR